MSFTYDFTTAPLLSQIRLLVADTDSANPVFSDDEVNQALALESSQGLFMSGQASPTANGVAVPTVPQIYSVRRSAALLLDALASNKSRLGAVTKLLDVSLDVGAAAKALREQAQAFRDMEANMGHFAIAEMVEDQFSARERVWKQFLRVTP